MQAACGCIETYLELANAPARDKQKLEEEESALAAMSLEDQKKLKLKKKKVRCYPSAHQERCWQRTTAWAWPTAGTRKAPFADQIYSSSLVLCRFPEASSRCATPFVGPPVSHPCLTHAADTGSPEKGQGARKACGRSGSCCCEGAGIRQSRREEADGEGSRQGPRPGWSPTRRCGGSAGRGRKAAAEPAAKRRQQAAHAPAKF